MFNQNNERFATYCPFCQISQVPSLLPQGLHEPPAYSLPPSPRPSYATLTVPSDSDDPPAYDSISAPQSQPTDTKYQQASTSSTPAPDVLHFLSPEDTLQSLSLAYNTPIPALRSTNNLFADHLVAARRTILIPGQYYKGGVSLSPRPPGGEEEEARRGKIRKWMVSCKVADFSVKSRYDIALLYLRQSEYDLDAAVTAYKEDEKWEREHPMNDNVKGKAPQGPRKRRIGGIGATGQLN
ncbi:hypothetical protein MMC19_007277 [Ptychographa xylographoides]|nr:hypothetical protein [Ptychographa xylographoides]